MLNSLIPELPNVSLVAFYGDKSAVLKQLIKQIQTYLINHQLLSKQFIPYQIEQVHGTIIGCEGIKTELGIMSKWFYQSRGETKMIDCEGLINYLQTQVNFPIDIRIGGYDLAYNYKFLSRDQHPYLRSFQLQPAAEQTIPVIIGWSWQNNHISRQIDNLRRNLQQFNLLHKYHLNNQAIDNDFYLRLGTINFALDIEDLQVLAKEIRDLLANQPTTLPINLSDLAFANYQDLALTPQTTTVLPLNSITASELRQLYLTLK
ncbi:hypothetical protein NIES4102_36140 [Chondrocystis sp. NIES-4102]|nr:hypothetical protein NIES4102_36140 [Chondrocystis sp. NIES-4102]